MKSYRFINGKLYLAEIHYKKGNREIIFMSMAHLACLSFYLQVQEIIDHFFDTGKVIYEGRGDDSDLMNKYTGWSYRICALSLKMFFQGDFLFYPANSIKSSIVEQLVKHIDNSPKLHQSLSMIAKKILETNLKRRNLKRRLISVHELAQGRCTARTKKGKKINEYLRKLLVSGNESLLKCFKRTRSSKVLIIYGAAHFYALDAYLRERGFSRVFVKWHLAF